jgi:uncharacterized protein YbjQ (UPF0145 family)
MNGIRNLIMAMAVLFASGCTIMDGNAIVTGEVREPISPEQVRIYRTAPERFEEIAIVDASAGHDFLKNSSLVNSALERLKEEAAKVGANGVLLLNVDERDAPSVSTSYGSATASAAGTSVHVSGTSTSVNRGDTYTRLRGIAIYVP